MKKENAQNQFHQAIINLLVAYKKSVLNINESGSFNYVKYEHILPEDKGQYNYINDEVRFESGRIKKHKYWYHLNSSQTLCLNFFVMLINRDYLSKLLSELLGFDINIVNSEFERVEMERSSNFDFYCEDEKGHKYYFEIKYTEDDVAKRTGASDPKNTFETIYRPLIEKGSYLKECLLEDNWQTFMFKHYQAYRNIVMANEEKGDYVFFITMKNNPGTYKELTNAINDANENLKNVKNIYWEQLIDIVLNLVSDDSELYGYYKEVKRKYFDYNN